VEKQVADIFGFRLQWHILTVHETVQRCVMYPIPLRHISVGNCNNR